MLSDCQNLNRLTGNHGRLHSAHWLASSLKLVARCPVSGCWPSCNTKKPKHLTSHMLVDTTDIVAAPCRFAFVVIRDVVICSKFYGKPCKGFEPRGVEIWPFLLLWPLAFTTACRPTTVQAVIICWFLLAGKRDVVYVLADWKRCKQGDCARDVNCRCQKSLCCRSWSPRLA